MPPYFRLSLVACRGADSRRAADGTVTLKPFKVHREGFLRLAQTQKDKSRPENCLTPAPEAKVLIVKHSFPYYLDCLIPIESCDRPETRVSQRPPRNLIRQQCMDALCCNGRHGLQYK